MFYNYANVQRGKCTNRNFDIIIHIFHPLISRTNVCFYAPSFFFIERGLGLRHENARGAAEEMMDEAGNIAMKTKDKMSNAASGIIRNFQILTVKIKFIILSFYLF